MDEATARRIVGERANGVCETCGQARATDWAHRKPRSQGGLWEPANGLSLCRRCHSQNHAHPDDAVALGRHLRSYQEPLAEPVRLRHGRVLLDNQGGMWWAPEHTLHLTADVAEMFAALNFEEGTR